jgi:hypothetical protein
MNVLVRVCMRIYELYILITFDVTLNYSFVLGTGVGIYLYPICER